MEKSELIFGVKFKQSINSDVLSTLVKVDATNTLSEILQSTLRHFFPDKSLKYSDYCFLLIDGYGKAITYVNEENLFTIDKNVVQLVELPNLAAEQLIQELNSFLSAPSDSSSDEDIDGVLRELTSLLPCRNFATEFVKQGGHEAIFRMVESFGVSEEQRIENSPKQNSCQLSTSSTWAPLMACLAELASYGINSSIDIELDNNSAAGEDEMLLCSQTDLFETVFGRESSRYMNELFSWKLVSEKFISVLIQQSQIDHSLETLRNQLKVILLILINCPTAADFIINQTGPEYIFQFFPRVHISTRTLDTNVAAMSPRPRPLQQDHPGTTTPRSSNPCSRNNSFSNEPTLCPANNASLGKEVYELLLDMIYAFMYRTRESGTFAKWYTKFFNARNLSTLVEHLPELQQLVNCNRTGRRLPSVSSQNQLASLPPQSSSSTSLWNKNGGIVTGNSYFLFPERPSSLGIVKKPETHTSGTDAGLLAALLRLQRVQFIYLKDQMNERVLPRDIADICSLTSSNEFEEQCSTEETLQNEEICRRLGFRNPTNPTEEFQEFPRQLGVNLLRTFIKASPNLVSQTLSRWEPVETHDRPAGSATHMTANPHHSSFPLVTASTRVTLLLCDLLGITRLPNLEPLIYPRPKCPHQVDRMRFYPFLFHPRASQLQQFEDLFVVVFSVFYYTWNLLSAGTNDLENVVSVLKEQLAMTLAQNPRTMDEFEQYISRFTPQVVRTTWKERATQNQSRLIQTHPAFRELHTDLTRLHEHTVRENRLNALTYHCPLEYVLTKGQKQMSKDNQKFEVVLSPDRKSLTLRDTKLCTREIWLLACIERVTTGVEEKVRKNPERTLVIHMLVRDTPEPVQIHLLARTERDFRYWLDGFQIILSRGPKFEQFNADVKRLVDLDMKIRALALTNAHTLPSKPKPIPPDPPEFDFDHGQHSFPLPC